MINHITLRTISANLVVRSGNSSSSTLRRNPGANVGCMERSKEENISRTISKGSYFWWPDLTLFGFEAETTLDDGSLSSAEEEEEEYEWQCGEVIVNEGAATK